MHPRGERFLAINPSNIVFLDSDPQRLKRAIGDQ
jgi:hypothetical protein